MSKKKSAQPRAEQHVKDIRRVTRKQYAAQEKLRIVLEGLRGEQSIAELYRREQIARSTIASTGVMRSLCTSSG